MVTALVLEKEWHYLCERIGSERFVWLLVHTSIFVPLLGNGADGTCFVQLTGAALSERPTNKIDTALCLKRKHGEADDESVPQNNPLPVPADPVALAKRSRTLERVDSRISVRSATSAPDLGPTSSRTPVGTKLERKPSEIVLVRSRMFYARCSRSKSGRVEVGLPSVHVLPRSSSKKELDKVLPSFTASSSSRSKSINSKQGLSDFEMRFHERRTRHLAKYIFPRQFGLHNVFTGARDFDTTTQPFRDYTVREVEIKALGAKRTPKPLRAILPVLAKVVARHDKLNYRALLDRCCPSRVPKGRLTAQERQQIVQDLAEAETLQPGFGCRDIPVKFSAREGACTVLGVSRQTNVETNAAAEKSSAKVELPALAPRKPRYTTYAVPTTGQVVHFVTLTLKSLLPRDLFGSLHNQNLVLSTIAEFVRLRRFETFNLHQISQSFRFTDVDWALPRQAVHRARRLTRQGSELRKRIVLELLYWLFDGLVIPLLRTTFYITETAAYRNKVMYFRQDDWHALSKPVLGQLKETIFEPLTRAEALGMMSSRKLGYSHVRLLPKETGVRPIVNLRRRSTKQVHTDQQSQQEGKVKGKTRGSAVMSAKQKRESAMLGQSINYILQSVFHVLTYVKCRMLTNRHDDTNCSQHSGGGNMLSSSVFGPNEIYTRLKTYKQHLSSTPKLYFVKLDVRCAFDSIDQSRLLDIIERMLSDTSSDGYRIHRFSKIMPTASHVKREFVRLARPDSEHIDFFDLASGLSAALHDVIFVDSVSYRYESTSLILKLLRQHVTENLVKIGKEFYRQKVGIPQGSSLSTLLCSFFYADMEANDEFLSKLGRDGKSLLLRYTDDFLLVTTSKRTAKTFYSVMRTGHPEYGCFISPEKTLTNFDLMDPNCANGPLVARIYGHEFPWCGLTINTRSLGVSTDLSRYSGLDIRDTLTVEYSRRPGGALVEKLIQSVKSRCHVLFTDTALNGDTRVYANMYASFLVAAVKFMAYLGELRRFKVVFEAAFLWRAIQRLVQFTSRYVGSRAASAKVKLERGKRRGKKWKVSCKVQPRYVHWLGYSAFLAVLSQPASSQTKEDGGVRYRSLDRATRHALVGLIETAAHQSSYTAARRRLGRIVASTLDGARRSLAI